MQYKSNNKCDTEAALQKYINYKKNIFFTFVRRSGLQRKSAAIITASTTILLLNAKKLGTDTRESYKKYISMDKDRKFRFNGVIYNSFVDCCRAYSVDE